MYAKQRLEFKPNDEESSGKLLRCSFWGLWTPWIMLHIFNIGGYILKERGIHEGLQCTQASQI